MFVDPVETIDSHHPFFMAIAITVTSDPDGTQLLSLEGDATVTPADGEPAPNVYTEMYTHGAHGMESIPSRVFMNGNSQAVRIPAEFRLSTDRVQISRTADGDLLIHPCPNQRGQALLQILAGFDSDFVACLEEQQAQKLPVQERELL